MRPSDRIKRRLAASYRIFAVFGIVSQGACHRASECSAGNPDRLSANAAERRIEAILPKDWNIAARVSGAVPYGVTPGATGNEASSIFLTLVGPERVEISGYYCERGTYCGKPIEAREAVEVWIMSAAFADTADPVAFTTRGASVIARCRGRAIYGLTSRYAGEAINFDSDFTGSSTERSRLPQTTGDLPVSWTTWRQALETVVR